MSEKRFIQLINLHIDGEISPSELEELEQEVATNPRRRDVYHSYCRLQQASQEVCQQFGRALTETVDLKKYQILARHSHGFQRGVLYSAGALAAACIFVVAAVALFQETQWGPSGGHSSVGPQAVAVEVFEPGRLNKNVQPVRMTASNSTTESLSFFGVSRASARTFQATSAPTFWEDEFRPAPSARAIRGRSSFDAPELVSFQFQR